MINDPQLCRTSEDASNRLVIWLVAFVDRITDISNLESSLLFEECCPDAISGSDVMTTHIWYYKFRIIYIILSAVISASLGCALVGADDRCAPRVIYC